MVTRPRWRLRPGEPARLPPDPEPEPTTQDSAEHALSLAAPPLGVVERGHKARAVRKLCLELRRLVNKRRGHERIGRRRLERLGEVARRRAVRVVARQHPQRREGRKRGVDVRVRGCVLRNAPVVRREAARGLRRKLCLDVAEQRAHVRSALAHVRSVMQ
eukprot:Amastigsp_a676618_39.p4 type:complete len:160 gc:universal Amastigsp_a676618_39:2077-2556(+)